MEFGQLKMPIHRQDMPGPVGASHVKDDKDHTHAYRRYGEHLTQDYYMLGFFMFIDVCRKYHRNSRSGKTDKEDEVCEIEAPCYLIG